jgi:hypothetical protein
MQGLHLVALKSKKFGERMILAAALLCWSAVQRCHMQEI